MKKLALALVCLVSVAFFASCDPEDIITNPNIEVVATDGYLQNNDVIDVNVEYPIGFKATSPTTDVELSKFYLDINGVRMVDSVISGTTFTYDDVLSYPERDIIDTLEIVATVVTEKEASSSVTMTVFVNREENLEVTDFVWKRDAGHDGVGLDVYGLEWTTNTSTNAIIKPMNGAYLHIFDNSEVWANTTTAAQKAALFAELPAEGDNQFTGVDVVNATQTYDYVLATQYHGENYLLHVTGSTANERSWHFTITGQAK